MRESDLQIIWEQILAGKWNKNKTLNPGDPWGEPDVSEELQGEQGH